MKFSYKAIKDGEIITKSIEADSADKVEEHLKSNNYSVINIVQEKKAIPTAVESFFSKVSFNNIVDMTRQLAIMLNAGLTLLDSFDILKKQAENPALAKVIGNIDNDIRTGNSFSSALQKYRKLFSNLYIALVKAGEASGKLDQILQKLADNLEKQRQFKGKVKGALIYPAIVVVAMIGVIFIMLTFVIPKLLEVFADFDVELPATTKLLIFISNLFKNFWPFILLSVFILVVGVKKYMSTKAGKKVFDQFFLKLPVVKRIVKISALVETTRTLGILVESGVSILDSLDIVVETTGNVVYQDALSDVKKKIEKGSSLGRALDETHVFPPIFVQMATVGEQTGHLDETLLKLADYFEAEAELAVKALTTLIEPAILLVLGLSVGFVVISIITPIFNLTSAL